MHYSVCTPSVNPLETRVKSNPVYLGCKTPSPSRDDDPPSQDEYVATGRIVSTLGIVMEFPVLRQHLSRDFSNLESRV